MNSGLRAYNEQNKLAQWVQIVSECRDSGMSVRQWCQEHGINISSYYKMAEKSVCHGPGTARSSIYRGDAGTGGMY